MAKQYELNDESVIVVIGSGAGGATVANELAQKGIDVVCLEAGSAADSGGRSEPSSDHGCQDGLARQADRQFSVGV